MPPKDASRLDEIPPTAVLPLQDWLKLLNSRGVDMRVAMSLAAKMCVRAAMLCADKATTVLVWG